MGRPTIFAALCVFAISSIGCSDDPESNVGDTGVDMNMVDMNMADMNVADMPADDDAQSVDSGLVDTGADVTLVNPAFCDPVGQNCVEPDASVCGVVYPPNMPPDFVCRESLGDVGLGESCTRPNGVAGEDDCAPGSFCTDYGLPTLDPPEPVCRALCEASDGCGENAHCLWLHPSVDVGLCLESCDPRGDDCVEGAKCSIFYSGTDQENFWICTNDSGANVGDECSGSQQCGAGQWCPIEPNEDGVRTCTTFCADDIPCPDGETCVPSTLTPPDFGACET